MQFLLITFFILTAPIYAQEEVLTFQNVREGQSYYSKFFHHYAVRKVLKRASREEIVSIYREALKKQKLTGTCSYDLNQDIRSIIDSRSLNIDLDGFIYVLRQEDEIDDVVAKVLLTANKVKTTHHMNRAEEDIVAPRNTEENKAKLDLITSFQKKFANDLCFDDAYRAFHGELLKLDKDIKSYELEGLNFKAHQDKRISDDLYLALEQGRINELEKGSLTLSSYQQKIRTLRINYPLRDLTERSDFTSVKVKKMKSSRRQKLFENYSDLQIIIMGNVIKKLRERLEYDSVEVVGYRNGVLQETIPLDPMERFRFAIKILRKEMSLLSLNTYFSGYSPDYMDLMMASYEIGIIPASELETVATLEEIWNPKKSFWDKAGVWIKTFSSVATIVIPPPYGFIPALVIVAIEATAGKKKDPNTNDPSVLF